MNQQEKKRFYEIILKSGFYAGQAMAGIELKQVEKNWKEFIKL